MPSGKVHDSITLATAIAAYPAWWLFAPVHDLAYFSTGVLAYLFSGLWLSDDLDIRSVSYRRWGILRFLWWPYQKLIPHRSWISHGILVGPTLRIMYFAAMFWICSRWVLCIVDYWISPLNRDQVMGKAAVGLAVFASTHTHIAMWAFGGLVMGGIVHTIADAAGSFARQFW